MKARVLLLIGAAFVAFTTQVYGQYKTFVLSYMGTSAPPLTNFVVDPGVAVQAVVVNGSSTFISGDSGVHVLLPSETTLQLTNRGGSMQPGDVVVGPAKIEMLRPTFPPGYSGRDVIYHTFRFIQQPSQSIPSTAVVIPSDAKGPVRIVLETSTNLVSWVEALPGTYGVSTPDRFFRVRAVQQ